MTNSTKETVKKEAQKMSENAKENINTLTENFKASTNHVAENVVYKAEATKDEAVNLIDNIKQLVGNYADADKINTIKSDVAKKAKNIKDNVSSEVAVAVEKTTDKVKEKPVSSIVVAAGVGALLGYLFASKKK